MNIPYTEDFYDKPEVIEQYGHTFRYIYDLKEEQREIYDEETNSTRTIILWTGVSVIVNGYPNHIAAFKAILSRYVDTDEELKIINDYNTALLFYDVDNPTALKTYKDYLALRYDIKTKVIADFTNKGFE